MLINSTDGESVRLRSYVLLFMLALLPLVFVHGIQRVSNLPKETFVALSLACIIGVLVLEKRKDKREISIFVPAYPLILSLLLLSFSWVSVIWSTNKHLGCHVSLQQTYCYLLFIIIILSKPNARECLYLAAGIPIGATFNSALALLHYWTDSTPLIHATELGGTFLNKNFAAQVSVIAAPFSVAGFWVSSNVYRASLCGFSFLILSLHVMHTGSRSAFLAYLLSTLLIVLSITVFKRSVAFPVYINSTKKLIFIIFTSLFLVGINYTDEGFNNKTSYLLNRYSSIFQGKKAIDSINVNIDKTTTVQPAIKGGIGRLQGWRNSIEIIEDNPILGVGEGNFQIIYPIYSSYDGGIAFSTERQNLRYLHNEYLEFAVEYGLVLFSLLMITIVLYLILSIKALIRSDSKLLLPFFAALISILVTSFFSSPLFWPTQKVYLAIILGVITSLIFRNREIRLKLMPFSYLYLVIILTVITTFSLARFTNHVKAEALYLDSLGYIRKEQYNKAKECLVKSVKKYRAYQHALMTLGAVQLHLNEIPQCIDTYDRLLKLFPYDYRALSNSVTAHLKNSDLNNALEQTLTILQIKPNDYAPTILASNLYRALGQPIKAEACLVGLAYSVNGNSEVFRQLSILSLEMNDPVRSEYWLDEMRRLGSGK